MIQSKIRDSLPSALRHLDRDAKGLWCLGEKKIYGKTVLGTLRRTFIFDENRNLVRIIEKVDTKNAVAQILKKHE